MSILAELPPNTIFAGDFRVVRKLSAGGMGAVYLAEQLSTGRQRALKLMHPGLVGSPDLRQKFALEARVGARVHSEHVVEVVAAGVEAEVPWLAMELLIGEDLATLIGRRGPLPKEEVVSILGQVCHGLAAAHAAGIVHRDLKPENIFLAQSRRAQESFTVKILDFGIAKVVEAARGSNTGAIGSPLWMAPEQTERDAEIAASTDIWALGLVTFFMLTGKPFWLAADQGDVALSAFLRELVIDPIPTASQRAEQLGAGEKIPAGFDEWFAHCVVRERTVRYSDAKQSFDALCLRLSVVPSTQTTIRIATGPQLAHSMEGELAAARTMIDDSRPSVLHAKRAASDEDEGARATVPVQGPSPVLLTLGGILLFFAVGGAAIFLIARRDTPKPDPSPSGSNSASALPFCPKGMVRVAGAEITIGSNAGPLEEQPEHPVKVASFCVDVLEVSVGDYADCVKKNGCATPQTTVEWPGITKEERDTFSVFCNYSQPGRRDHPMNCVSFDEASAYCRWAGKKLPAEEQWEYAARGTDGRAYPWGYESPSPRRMNGCDEGCAKAARRTTESLGLKLRGDDNWESTSPVGAYPEGVSFFGVFDMAGNVAEWTDTTYCPYGQSACADDKDPAKSRVTRGGSWMTDAPIAMRSSARTKTNPASRAPDVGLRCVK